MVKEFISQLSPDKLTPEVLYTILTEENQIRKSRSAYGAGDYEAA